MTITGTGFTATTAVTFGGTSAVFKVNSDTSITATEPVHTSGMVDVQVTNPGGTSATNNADQFTYGPAPDLSITVTSPPVVFVGSPFTETYQVTNIGGSPAAAPTLAVLTKEYASSASSSSTTCVDTQTGHSGRGGGITHTGYLCPMPAGSYLAPGDSLTVTANFVVATTATISQTLKAATTSLQQNNVSHSVVNTITPVMPAAPSVPSSVGVSQDVGSLVVNFTPGTSTDGAPITSTVVAVPVAGGVSLTGSVVTTTAGPTSISIPDLVGNTEYAVTVTSSDAGGSASAAAVDFTTAVAVQPPGAPTLTRAAWNTDTEIVAAWTAGTPGDSITTDYEVCATAVDSSQPPVVVDAGTSLVAGINLPESVDNWSIQVRAENAAGWGPWSTAMVVGASEADGLKLQVGVCVKRVERHCWVGPCTVRRRSAFKFRRSGTPPSGG